MIRFAQTVLLKDDPELIRQYEYHHAHPWHEMVEQVKKIGVKRAFIYRFGRQLFLFMEADDDFDFERDLAKYTEDPKAKEWDELMASFQEPPPGAPEGATWVAMKEIYSFDVSA